MKKYEPKQIAIIVLLLLGYFVFAFFVFILVIGIQTHYASECSRGDIDCATKFGEIPFSLITLFSVVPGFALLIAGMFIKSRALKVVAFVLPILVFIVNYMIVLIEVR